MAQPRLRQGDTVRLLFGNPAHLMTVRAASLSLVLCAWFGENGRVQHAPYAPEDLELVERQAHAPEG